MLAAILDFSVIARVWNVYSRYFLPSGDVVSKKKNYVHIKMHTEPPSAVVSYCVCDCVCVWGGGGYITKNKYVLCKLRMFMTHKGETYNANHTKYLYMKPLLYILKKNEQDDNDSYQLISYAHYFNPLM